MDKDLSRFMSYVEIKEDGCWGWRGAKDIKGYAIMYYQKKTCFAHRVSLLLHNRVKYFISGNVIRHSCKNKSCVNPDHLSEGTLSENAKDKVRDGTDLSGDKCHFAKLNWTLVSEIRKKSEEGMKHCNLSKEYNVSASCISSIVNNKTWLLV